MNENESESRKTVADIVADIRERAENAMRNGERLVHNEAVANMLTFVADRIEAAAKREHLSRRAIKVPIEVEVLLTGNAAAMREALVWMRERMNAALHDGSLDCYEALSKIEAALTKPPRNCDVGTVEEQDNRMDVYCQTRKCESCPLWDNVNNGVRCEFTWAQMPYKAEEGGQS